MTSILPHSMTRLPLGSVTTKLTFSGICIRFGLTKNRVLPEPEPPMTMTFLFLAYLGR